MRSRTHLFRSAAFAAMGALLLTSCGCGGGGGTPTPTPSPTPTPTPTPTGGLYTPPAAAELGRAYRRERACLYVTNSGVVELVNQTQLEKKYNNYYYITTIHH